MFSIHELILDKIIHAEKYDFIKLEPEKKSGNVSIVGNNNAVSITKDVVRCKDCLHYISGSCYHPRMSANNIELTWLNVDENGFCAWGEMNE